MAVVSDGDLVLESHSYDGRFDHFQNGRLIGWAWNSSEPNAPIAVEIQSDKGESCVAMADVFRDDLNAAGLGNGHHGFVVDLLHWNLTDTVATLRVAGSGELLIKAEFRFDLSHQVAARPRFDDFAKLIQTALKRAEALHTNSSMSAQR